MNEHALTMRVERLEAQVLLLQTACYALIRACDSPKLRTQWAKYAANVATAQMQAKNDPKGAKMHHASACVEEAYAQFSQLFQGFEPPYALGAVDTEDR